ncbi:MAG TPA: class I tRNA ligase family protein [Solirubrobacteraceae bacterium]|jgi:methionyl-tRNA synthetase|nr:class I tRNA ligase family protein [Solirubrobacteraceae bacterium]
MSSFYVTTPIYYVNAAPHLGHAYTTIAADVLARHHRQRGEEVFFLTGTDEHGEPVADAAHALGVEPQELADRNSERFRALAPKIEASNDFFIRTTDPEHMRVVQDVLSRVRENGHVYMGTYEGWYCPKCADFKAENEVDEGELCPIHHVKLGREQEDNYFFALSRFQEPLERLYAEHEDFVAPRSRYNEALSFIKSGLRDVPLTRHKLTWGVPVPWDEEHVFYVWFDALLNYYSALAYARAPAEVGEGTAAYGRTGMQRGTAEGAALANPAAPRARGGHASSQTLTETFWPADVHLIAKDILRFHTVYWPALLMATEIELPRRVFVHGYLLMDGEKMSKSLGNVLDPFAVIERFGADALRFYLLRDVPFGQDGSVSTASFEQRYESELANDYGNLASRSIAMIVRYRDGVVDAGAPDELLGEDFAGLPELVASLLDRVELTNALDEIWQRVRRLNRYVEEQAPWQLAKDPERAADLDRVLRTLAEGLRVVSVLLHPYLPDATEKLLAALDAPDLSYAGADFGAGQIRLAQKLEPLFPKKDIADEPVGSGASR